MNRLHWKFIDRKYCWLESGNTNKVIIKLGAEAIAAITVFLLMPAIVYRFLFYIIKKDKTFLKPFVVIWVNRPKPDARHISF